MWLLEKFKFYVAHIAISLDSTAVEYQSEKATIYKQLLLQQQFLLIPITRKMILYLCVEI